MPEPPTMARIGWTEDGSFLGLPHYIIYSLGIHIGTMNLCRDHSGFCWFKKDAMKCVVSLVFLLGQGIRYAKAEILSVLQHFFLFAGIIFKIHCKQRWKPLVFVSTRSVWACPVKDSRHRGIWATSPVLPVSIKLTVASCRFVWLNLSKDWIMTTKHAHIILLYIMRFEDSPQMYL